MNRLQFGDDLQRVDWKELESLFLRAPLGRRDANLLRRLFAASQVRCFAWLDGQLIGAGRAITDGVSSSAVYDVVVDPDCQRQGVGTQLMRNLLAKLPIGQVMLISVPGREEFYESLGFKRLRTGFVLMSSFDAWEREGYFVDERTHPRVE